MVLDVESKEVFGIRQSENHSTRKDLDLDLCLSQNCSRLGEDQRGERADVSYLIKWKDGSPLPGCLL